MFTRVNVREYYEILEQLKEEISPPSLMVVGKAGIGKTQIVKEFAKQNDFGLVEVYLSIREPFDLTGAVFPIEKKEGNEVMLYSERAIPEIIKMARKVEEKGKRVVLLFDEFTHATDTVLKSLYQLLLEKKIENQELPPDTLTILVGNLDYEGLGWSIENFPKAFLDRCLRIELIFDIKQFVEYMVEKKFNEDLISFVLRYPEIIEDDKYLMTPRRVELCNRYVSNDLMLKVAMGEQVYDMFKVWKEKIKKLDVMRFLENPKEITKLPKDEIIAIISQVVRFLKDKKYYPMVCNLLDYVKDEELLFYLITWENEFKEYVIKNRYDLIKKIVNLFK